jgi:hypothetical protein
LDHVVINPRRCETSTHRRQRRATQAPQVRLDRLHEIQIVVEELGCRVGWRTVLEFQRPESALDVSGVEIDRNVSAVIRDL